MKFKGKKYISIPIDQVKSDQELNCDLFVYLRLNLRMVKILKFDQIFDGDRVSLYKNKGLKEFYIINPMAHPEDCPNLPKGNPLAANLPPAIKEAIQSKIDNPKPEEDEKDEYYDSPILKAMEESKNSDPSGRNEKNNIGSIDEEQENKKVDNDYTLDRSTSIKEGNENKNDDSKKINPDALEEEKKKFSNDIEALSNEKEKKSASGMEEEFGINPDHDQAEEEINLGKDSKIDEEMDELNFGKQSKPTQDEETINFSPTLAQDDDELHFGKNEKDNDESAFSIDGSLQDKTTDDSFTLNPNLSPEEIQKIKGASKNKTDQIKISGSTSSNKDSKKFGQGKNDDHKNKFSADKLNSDDEINFGSPEIGEEDDIESKFSNDPLNTDKNTLVKGKKGNNNTTKNSELLGLKKSKNAADPNDADSIESTSKNKNNKNNPSETEISDEIGKNKKNSEKNIYGKTKDSAAKSGSTEEEEKENDPNKLIGASKLIGKDKRLKNAKGSSSDDSVTFSSDEEVDENLLSISANDLNDRLSLEKQLAEELIHVKSQLSSEVSDEAITKISKEAEELSSKFGNKLAKKIASIDKEEKFSFKDGERLALEKISLFEDEIKDIGRTGNNIIQKIKSDSKSVTEEDIKEYVFLAKFVQQKSETSKSLVGKLNQLREEYTKLGPSDFDKKEQVYNQIVKVQDKLAKVAAMDPSSQKELAEIGVEANIQPAKWLDCETPDEPMDKRMDRIVKNMQKISEETGLFSKTVAESQNKFVKQREEDLAEKEISQVAKKTRLAPESVYWGSKAVSLAIASGYSEKDLLADIAKLAIFEIDPNVKSFQKIPEEVKAISSVMNGKEAIPFLAVRDIQKIVSVIQLLASITHIQHMSFNFTAKDILAGMELLRSEPKDIDILFLDQARQYLHNGLTKDEQKISRESAMNATREIAKWV